MKFATIRACLGWAFQMSQTVNLKTAKYGEQSAPAFGGESQGDQIMTAINIMNKVSRLPEDEQAVIVAYFTGDQKAVIKAACCLPMGWPTPMRRMFARSWARGEQLEMSQAEIAATYNFAQKTASRRWNEACSELNKRLNNAMAVLELQMLDLVSVPGRANMHRLHHCIAA